MYRKSKLSIKTIRTIMEKKTTGTVITKNFAKKMETISPF